MNTKFYLNALRLMKFFPFFFPSGSRRFGYLGKLCCFVDQTRGPRSQVLALGIPHTMKPEFGVPDVCECFLPQGKLHIFRSVLGGEAGFELDLEYCVEDYFLICPE